MGDEKHKQYKISHSVNRAFERFNIIFNKKERERLLREIKNQNLQKIHSIGTYITTYYYDRCGKDIVIFHDEQFDVIVTLISYGSYIEQRNKKMYYELKDFVLENIEETQIEKDKAIEELDRLHYEFKIIQKQHKKGTEGYIFYEGCLNGVSSSIERVERIK